MQYGPDPSSIYPNENIKSICYINNLITRPNIIVGEYTSMMISMVRNDLKSTLHITMNL